MISGAAEFCDRKTAGPEQFERTARKKNIFADNKTYRVNNNYLDVVPPAVVDLSSVQVGSELSARQTDAGHFVSCPQVGHFERSRHDVMQQKLMDGKNKKTNTYGYLKPITRRQRLYTIV